MTLSEQAELMGAPQSKRGNVREPILCFSLYARINQTTPRSYITTEGDPLNEVRPGLLEFAEELAKESYESTSLRRIS
jgi:hypothetical protein